MKRRRESREEDPDDGKKKKRCQTRWSTKSEQRSGVVTVDEEEASSSSSSAFKPRNTTPPPPPPPPPLPPRLHTAPPPSAYLLRLRELAFEALVDCVTVHSLVCHVSRKFLLSPTKTSWNEECESVLALLYVALHYPTEVAPHFAKEIALEFIGRWLADTEAQDLGSLPVLFTDDVKFANFSILALLLGNLVPQEVEVLHLEECLSWSSVWSSGTGLPQWLLDALGGEKVNSLKNLLFASFMMLKGIPWKVESTRDYAGVHVDFLAACRLYKEANYGECLTLLQGIAVEKCGNSLQGWILWCMGMAMYKLGKPNMALLKLQESVEKCDSCVPAIFNVSQIFHEMGTTTAEMETLSLLTKITAMSSTATLTSFNTASESIPSSGGTIITATPPGISEPTATTTTTIVGSGGDWQPYSTMNLQSALLRLHHPPPDDLSCLAHFMLAVRCLHLKMYEESCSNVALLQQKLQNAVVSLSASLRTLFRLEDEIPSLPSSESIALLQALACFQNEDYETTVTVLDQFDKEEIGYCSYYEDSVDNKMVIVTMATACYIKSEALVVLERTDDALRGCIGLVQDLSWVKGQSNSGWETCILILKILLYSTLSDLHGSKKNTQSQRHFQRLATQNLGLLPQNRSLPVWEGLSLPNRLIMDNIYFIINDRLSTVEQ